MLATAGLRNVVIMCGKMLSGSSNSHSDYLNHTGIDTIMTHIHDAKDMLSNIKLFLKGGWSHVKPDQLSIRLLTGGWMNTVIFVGLPADHLESDHPSSVVYRLYGGTVNTNTVNFVMSEYTDMLTCYELGRSGRAPHIYGLIPGGRIEEFIEGHLLRHDEMSDPVIMGCLGEAFAAYHALHLPIPRTPSQSFDFMLQKTPVMQWLDKRSELEMVFPHLEFGFYDRDFDATINWLICTHDKIESPVVFCHCDNGLINIMVRERPVEGEKRVVLIDYENSKYLPRSLEFGWMFMNKTIKWDDEQSKVSGSAYPNPEQRKVFFEAYIKEVACQPNYPYVRQDLNSFEHLELEAAFGALVVTAALAMSLRRRCGEILKKRGESFVTVIPHLDRLHDDLMAQFTETYRALV